MTYPLPEALPDEPVLPQIGTWGPQGGAAAPGDEPEYGTVQYFGTDLRVVLDPLSLELSFEEFMDIASEIEGVDDTRAMGAVRKFVRTIMHPNDFSTWWRLVRTHRQDITAQMEFAKWVLEQVTGHPTERLSGSEDGQPRTGQNSTADVSLRVQHRLEDQGRADLALVVLGKREVDAQQG